eukprot:1156174-Pelagomonas_calceolata.AAC.2
MPPFEERCPLRKMGPIFTIASHSHTPRTGKAVMRMAHGHAPNAVHKHHLVLVISAIMAALACMERAVDLLALTCAFVRYSTAMSLYLACFEACSLFIWVATSSASANSWKTVICRESQQSCLGGSSITS